MRDTRQTAFRGTLVYKGESEVVTGTLFEHQELIHDGTGYNLKGLKSWDAQLGSASLLAAKQLGSGGNATLRLEDGREGKVFVTRLDMRSATLQGTGPLAKPSA